MKNGSRNADVDRRRVFNRGEHQDSGQGLSARILPNNAEAEQAMLAAMVINPNVCVPDAIARFGFSGDVFYFPDNGTAYAAICELWKQGSALDEVTISNRLRDGGKFERDPLEFANTLFNFIPNASHFAHYADIVAEKKLLRDVIEDGTQEINRAYEEQADVPGLIRDVEHRLLRLTERNVRRARRRDIKEIVMDVMDSLSDREKVLGISTGFSKLDEIAGGLAEGAKIVIAGETSSGKSSLAHNIAVSLAIKRKIPTAYFSFEMSENQTVQRIMQTYSEVSVRDIVEGRADLFRQNRFGACSKAVMEAPLFVVNERLDIAGIQARLMQLRASQGLRVAIVDYLQIIPEKKQRGESRSEQLDRMSGETKQIAHALGITLIELSQVTIKDDSVRTRGSQGIINDADQLWILGVPDEDDSRRFVDIGKQRDGGKGRVEFRFGKDITKFWQADDL